MRRWLVFLPLFGLLALGYAAKCPKQRTSPGREILCYTSTTDVKLLEDSICRCTTLVHQGHDLKDLSTSGIEDFKKSLKELNPFLQIVLSVNDAEGTLKTSAHIRQEAAARIVRILNEVDGVELNVTAGTKERLVHFIQGLKTELVRKSKDKRILLVLPTRPDDLAKQFDLKALSKYADLFTIPTHYLVDDDESFRTFHPSRLMGIFDMLNIDSLVDLITGMGAGKRKILVTLPASAYKFTLEKNEANAPRDPTKEKQPVPISRSELCEIMNEGEWVVERDEDLTAPYAFKDDIWIAFEDKISAGIKGKYVLLRDLAGIGIHNVDTDIKSKCGKSLTEEVYHSFTDHKRKTREAVLSSLQEDLQQPQNAYSSSIKSSEFRIVRVVDTDGKIHAIRENTQTEFSCPKQGYFVHPKSCNRFYRCVKFNQGIDDFSVFEFDCPAGLAFDERTEVCVWPGSISEGSACPGSSEIAPSKGAKFTCPDHPGYYTDPNNCRFFYACFDLGEHELTAYEFRCPYGLVFDEKKLICEWPYLVPSCGDGGTYERHDYGGGESGYGGSGHESGNGGYGGEGGHGGDGGYGTGHGGDGGYENGHGGDGGYDTGHGGDGGYEKGRGGDGGYETGHGGDGEYEKGRGGNGGYETGHGGDGGYDKGRGGDGGYDKGRGGNGGYEKGRGGDGGYETGHGGYGGQDGHESGQGGYGGHGGTGGHGSNEGGHGGAGENESGQGGYGGHGGSGGHGTGQGGHGGVDGHGGEGGDSGYGGHNSGGHGTGQGGHGHGGGGGDSGYGGHDSGGHETGQGGHGGVDGHGGGGGDSGYGGHDSGGHGGDSGHGGHTTSPYVHHTTTTPYVHHTTSPYVHRTTSPYVHHTTSPYVHHTTSPYVHHTTVHHTTIHSGYDGHNGGDESSKEGHGGPSESGYDDSGRGDQGGGYDVSGHDGKKTTIHTGNGGHAGGHSTIHPGTGGYTGHHQTTVNSGDGGYDREKTTIHSGYGHVGSTQGGYEGSSQDGYDASAHGGHTAGTQGYTKVKTEYPVTSHIGHTPAVSIFTGKEGHTTGYSGHSYGVDSGLTTIDTGVHTGITAGGYDTYTPVIQYGGHTGSVTNQGTIHGGSGHTGTAGTTTYHGNFGDSGSGVSSGIAKGSYDRGSSRGTTYHGNYETQGYVNGGSTGSIISGAITHGVIGTGDSTSGTVHTHGDRSGTVLTGSSQQGEIVTGINQPGYVHTQTGTPGYVITNGVKTVYDGSDSKSTLSQGTYEEGVHIGGEPAPGVMLTGNSNPGTYLVGQTSPGVIVGGGVTHGVTVGDGQQYYTGGSGSSVYHGTAGSIDSGQTTFTNIPKTANFPGNSFTGVMQDTGYRTNEYYDNGGRSTIRYNNGEITHKYTEDDVRNHRNQFGTFPTFDVNSYDATSGSQGFTKTGPTKTGITTAQLGGSATYVIGSTQPRPFTNSQNIGADAFSSGQSTKSPDYTYTSPKPDYVDGSVDDFYIYRGSSTKSSSGGSSSGYTYDKPKVQLNTFGITGSTYDQEIPASSTPRNPFLDVHVYNNPSVVTSAPVTAEPAVVNTYNYNKPSSVSYKESTYQAANLPTSDVSAETYYPRQPVTDQRRFPPVSSTVAPIAFTTGPLENFRSTVFEAARIPGSISTIRPVIDNGYKTVVQSTAVPIIVNTDGFGYSQSNQYRNDYGGTKDKTSLDVNVAFQQPDFGTQDNYDTIAPAVIGNSGYATSKTRRPFITQSAVTYERPTVQQKVIYDSAGSSGYSEANENSGYYTKSEGSFGQKVSQGSVTPAPIYNAPKVTIRPQIYNIPSSTLAPAVGVTYREPFQINVSFDQSTSRPTPRPRVPSEGYRYSTPTVKFVTSTESQLQESYKTSGNQDFLNSKIIKTGGSPINPNIPRTEVEKLITNYDRGNVKFTPSYESTLNKFSEDLGNANRYSGAGNAGQSYDSTIISSAGKSQSGGYNNRIYSTTPRYEGNTDSVFFGNKLETGSSGLSKGNKFETSSSGLSKGNLEVNIRNGQVPSTTYSPIISSTPGRRIPTQRRPSYSSTVEPSITTYSGNYNRGTSASYEVTTANTAVDIRPKGKGKVIVKFSDLHPLLLGKLGAECTCKADPFASFRGSKPLTINSSKGRVDLRNYDESEVYVDLEASKENGDYDSPEYSTDLNGFSRAKYQEPKYQTPVIAVFDSVTPVTKSQRPTTYLSPVSSTERPISSTHLPVSSTTYLPPISTTKRPVSSTYLPPSSTYLPVAGSSQLRRGGVRASKPNDGSLISASFRSDQAGSFRAGKNLGGSGDGNRNALNGQGAAFDRYGPGGLRDSDEILEGVSDCARPGLFRHPNFCNKFYACHYDEWKKKFTLHVFNCPVHLTFDSGAGGCNWPSKGPACQDDNLLV